MQKLPSMEGFGGWPEAHAVLSHDCGGTLYVWIVQELYSSYAHVMHFGYENDVY